MVAYFDTTQAKIVWEVNRYKYFIEIIEIF